MTVVEPTGTRWAATRRATTRRASQPVRALRAVPHLGTWSGLALTCAGALLLVLAWGRTAALTDVALQLPYLISAGCTGLGCIAVGVTVLNLSAKHRDAAERARQSAELRTLLGELRAALAAEPAPLPDRHHR